MTLRDWIGLSATLILLVSAFVWGMRCSASASGTVVYVTDTLKLMKIVQDTVLSWKQRIVWKEVKPETIFVYGDTINPDTVWTGYPEAIVALDYKAKAFNNGDLQFSSVKVINDSQLVYLGYSYRVGGEFAIRSKGNGFYVKTKRGYPGLRLAIGCQARIWGDSACTTVLPYAEASVMWKGFSIGPRLDTRGLQLKLQYEWRF